MKSSLNVILILVSSFISISIHAQSTLDTALLKGAEIKFSELIHDFGDVKEGDILSFTFKFRNIGNDTLKIKDVRTTCGCTTSEWDSTRVYLTGEQGEIKIILDTKDKMSLYNKPFYISSNAKSSMVGITLRANILKR